MFLLDATGSCCIMKQVHWLGPLFRRINNKWQGEPGWSVRGTLSHLGCRANRTGSELCGWQEGDSWSIWLQELAIAIPYEVMWKFMRELSVWAESLNLAWSCAAKRWTCLVFYYMGWLVTPNRAAWLVNLYTSWSVLLCGLVIGVIYDIMLMVGSPVWIISYVG